MCVGCQANPWVLGVLCAECAAEITTTARICPEQIRATTIGSGPKLIDRWGRAHSIGDGSVVGRQPDGAGILVTEPTVSRVHARIEDGTSEWRLRDLGSANGTSIDGELIRCAPLREGARVFVGSIGFIFVANAPTDHETPPGISATIEASEQVRSPFASHAPSDTDQLDDFESETTDVGLPSRKIRLVEPSGGGGGVLEIDGREVKLSFAQAELMRVLLERAHSETDKPQSVRGFVRSGELVGSLSWDTPHPEEAHVKHLVRRTRATLRNSGLDDLIESRHGFGYRLRVGFTSPDTPS